MTVFIAARGAARADDQTPTLSASIPELAALDSFKKQLADRGIALQLGYIGDVLDNTSGGRRQGAIYDGQLQFVLDADMQKLAGWQGGTFHTNAYWIQGTGLSRYYIGNFLTVSNIEALPTVRLYELWYEQKVLDDKVAFRFGQLGADSEFITSKYGALFLNSTFSWPDGVAVDLPSGGPAYPLAAMGARLKIGGDSDPFNTLIAVFDGDAAGPGLNDPQRRDPYGLNFRLQDPPLAMEELQYRYNQDKNATGLPGTLKLGAYEHLGHFPSLQINAQGLPLGIVGGQAAEVLGDWALYGVWEQQVYRLGNDASKGVGVFVRAVAMPGDRNIVDLYIDGGVNFAGLIPGRPDDAFGVAAAFAKISDAARELDLQQHIFPQRQYEAALEVTYQAPLVAGWNLQPDFQYIVNPGGRVPNGKGGVVPNAVVAGLRTTMNF